MLRIFPFFSRKKDRDAVKVIPFDQTDQLLSDLSAMSSASAESTRQVIHLTRFQTPLGLMYACGVKDGICMLDYADKKDLISEFEHLVKSFDGKIVPGNYRHFRLLLRQLREYFNGKRKVFTVPMAITGTEFQRSVWKVLQDIPFGSTWSYTEQAETLKKPSALRAIAHANSLNRLAILIPCHRVIGIDGDLRGYSGGHGRKKWLLDFEQNVRYGQSSLNSQLLFP